MQIFLNIEVQYTLWIRLYFIHSQQHYDLLVLVPLPYIPAVFCLVELNINEFYCMVDHLTSSARPRTFSPCWIIRLFWNVEQKGSCPKVVSMLKFCESNGKVFNNIYDVMYCSPFISKKISSTNEKQQWIISLSYCSFFPGFFGFE